MRKMLVPSLAVVAVLALAAIPAAGAKKVHAVINRCGTLYTPPCRTPTIVVHSMVTCQHTGTTLHFPITVKGNAGIKKVKVQVGGRTIKMITYTGAPTSKSFSVTVSTRGAKPGLFTLTVMTMDVKGKTVTRSAHFTICKPKPPVFTG